jgi:hypothetical protein
MRVEIYIIGLPHAWGEFTCIDKSLASKLSTLNHKLSTLLLG